MKQFFESIKTYISYIMAVSAAIGVLYTGFRFFDNISSADNKIDQLLKSDSLRTTILIQTQRDVNSIKYEIQDIKDNQQTTNDQLSKFKQSYVKRLANDKSLTKEEFIQYMDGLYNDLDLKKNEMNYLENRDSTTALK